MTAWPWVGAARCSRVLAVAALVLSGCELNEVTVADSRDVVVAEVLLQVGSSTSRITGFLHRGRGAETDEAVPDADIRLTVDGGVVIQLFEVDLEECLVVPERGEPVPGTCYAAGSLASLRPEPGDGIQLEIRLPDGSRLTGETVIAGDFEVVTPAAPTCVIPPLETREIRWTSSEGAWAYVNETRISGLRDVLAEQGIPVESDPLDLLGVSVSAADTTIVFPSEFGVFERFDLDRELALLLQEGLPQGVDATVLIGAADRNWVNWVRGGDFNPSGEIRVPSVRGDGTGVLGSVVVRTIRMRADTTAVALPPC